jgi:hypothetical protein
MGIFGSLFGKKKGPAGPNPIRETLFGDMPLAQWPVDVSIANIFPWDAFVTARSELAAGNSTAAVSQWQRITSSPELEPRHHLQAWHFLRQQGQPPPTQCAKQVLGVVIEVGMPQGLDLLAAYVDHSARYYNFSGSGVVWEHPDATLDPAIDELIAAAQGVVERIGPWTEPRPAPPPRDQARLNFLTPSGLHFGQGPMAALSNDALGGHVLRLGTALMLALMAKAGKAPPNV